jgi:copper(I)-binding protein
MLLGLKKPLEAAQTFPVTLTFEKAGSITIDVPVGPLGAMGPSQGS